MRPSSDTRTRAHLARNVVAMLAMVILVGAACSPVTPERPTASTAGRTSPPASPTAPLPAASSASAAPAAASMFGPLPGAIDDEDLAARLQAVVDAAVAGGAPDMMAAVITPGGAWSGAAGVGGADRRAASPEDAYYVGAISQIF